MMPSARAVVGRRFDPCIGSCVERGAGNTRSQPLRHDELCRIRGALFCGQSGYKTAGRDRAHQLTGDRARAANSDAQRILTLADLPRCEL
jgi:hypothetical protein